ncbi:MAG: RNA polymerase sigma factor [Methylobacter sp.]|nr:MAG: RNA polymerase sigma factor [Methylobacter sp.]
MNLLPESGFSAIFLLHRKDLMQFLTYKVHCAETAADLTQETYLRIADHPDVGNIENMRAYLFRIANNLALDYLRSQTRQNKRDAGPVTEGIISCRPEPDDALSDRQQLEFLEQIIYDLPPKCRTVFLMSRVEGKSYTEISNELAISPRTVESHMRKALEQIRKQFD